MTRFRQLVISVCFVAFAASPALADFHGHSPMGFGGPMPMMMLLRRANLTADQQTKINQIIKSSFADVRPLMKQLRNVHEQIAAKLLGPGAVKSSDFSTLQKQESAIRNQIDTQLLATALKVRAVLTPDQLSKVATLHTKLEALHAQAEALLGEDGPPSAPME